MKKKKSGIIREQVTEQTLCHINILQQFLPLHFSFFFLFLDKNRIASTYNGNTRTKAVFNGAL